MKKIILISFLTIFVFQLFAQEGDYKEITVEDIWQKYLFFPKSIDGAESMKSGEYYTVFDGMDYNSADFAQEIFKYEYKTGKIVDTIINFTELKISGVSSEYEFSEDESKLLFYNNANQIYRHSFTADFYIYDLKTKKTNKVSENGAQQLATFSPDGKKVSFFRNNNLYIKNIDTKKEQQITTDGKYNSIINGAPDWVYEEEFGFNKAYEWSPDGKYLAYIKFDESKVAMFNMTKFAGLAPKLEANVLYPENYTYKYPKAGDDNSIVTVHVYNTETSKTKIMELLLAIFISLVFAGHKTLMC